MKSHPAKIKRQAANRKLITTKIAEITVRPIPINNKMEITRFPGPSTCPTTPYNLYEKTIKAATMAYGIRRGVAIQYPTSSGFTHQAASVPNEKAAPISRREMKQRGIANNQLITSFSLPVNIK